MVKAIGINTGIVYALGDTKADVMRTLQINYPKITYQATKSLYPEPLRLVK